MNIVNLFFISLLFILLLAAIYLILNTMGLCPTIMCMRNYRPTLPYETEKTFVEKVLNEIDEEQKLNIDYYQVYTKNYAIWMANRPYADMSVKITHGQEVHLTRRSANKLRSAIDQKLLSQI